MKRVDRLKNLIRVARGKQAPDLVLKEGRVLNVFSGEIIRAAGDSGAETDRQGTR